jgi:hypothetical protein
VQLQVFNEFEVVDEPIEKSRQMCQFLMLAPFCEEMMRIQATTDTRNLASQKVLEKTGFKKEGTLRKYMFVRGELRDQYLYSILREEWKEPRILTSSISSSGLNLKEVRG